MTPFALHRVIASQVFLLYLKEELVNVICPCLDNDHYPVSGYCSLHDALYSFKCKFTVWKKVTYYRSFFDK